MKQEIGNIHRMPCLNVTWVGDQKTGYDKETGRNKDRKSEREKDEEREDERYIKNRDPQKEGKGKR